MSFQNTIFFKQYFLGCWDVSHKVVVDFLPTLQLKKGQVYCRMAALKMALR